MLRTKVGNYIITWLCNPSEVGSIPWKDINRPCEETVNFEPDGDGRSKYVYAHRNRDNKLTKVAKAVRNYLFLPFIAGTSQFMVLINLLYQYDAEISLMSLYGIMFLLFAHYLLSIGESNGTVSKNQGTQTSYYSIRQARVG